ncbi:hypothetical protein SKAU_G00303870 [Synaphobranchus kaupii]|uniref:Uncharacterized protein n=1 Tax=Synaphobranchus kaupii TaxID=118154 RepID=A0A9Q1EW73_SYNKA|nr:hypothetical protein SKAU_G00303870 [Synaphobranchus kaupii]
MTRRQIKSYRALGFNCRDQADPSGMGPFHPLSGPRSSTDSWPTLYWNSRAGGPAGLQEIGETGGGIQGEQEPRTANPHVGRAARPRRVTGECGCSCFRGGRGSALAEDTPRLRSELRRELGSVKVQRLPWKVLTGVRPDPSWPTVGVESAERV